VAMPHVAPGARGVSGVLGTWVQPAMLPACPLPFTTGALTKEPLCMRLQMGKGRHETHCVCMCNGCTGRQAAGAGTSQRMGPTHNPLSPTSDPATPRTAAQNEAAPLGPCGPRNTHRATLGRTQPWKPLQLHKAGRLTRAQSHKHTRTHELARSERVPHGVCTAPARADVRQPRPPHSTVHPRASHVRSSRCQCTPQQREQGPRPQSKWSGTRGSSGSPQTNHLQGKRGGRRRGGGKDPGMERRGAST
jgi:hypothetical protein